MKTNLVNILNRFKVLASGSFVAQIILVVTTPVITRIFSPDQFGVAAVAIAVATIFGAISTLRYENGFYVTKDKTEQFHISVISLLCVFAFSCISLLGLWLYATYFETAKYPVVEFMIYVPILVLLIGIGNVVVVLSLVQEKQKTVAISEIGHAITQFLVRISLGITVSASSASLVVGNIFAQMVRVTILCWSAFPRLMGQLVKAKEVEMSKLLNTFVKFREYLLFSTPTVFLKNSSKNLPILLLGAFYEPAIVGLYAVSHRVIIKASKPISQAVRRAYIVEISKIRHNDELVKKLYIFVVSGIAIAGLVPVFLFVLWGAEIFEFVLGSNWRNAGLFAAYLAPMLLSQFMALPASAVFVVYRKQKRWLQISFIATSISIAVFTGAVIHEVDALSAVASFSIANIFVNLCIVMLGYVFCVKAEN